MTKKKAFDPNAAASENSGIFGLQTAPSDAKVVIIPVPWDATTSYRPGTANGPQHILEASRQVDLFDVEYNIPFTEDIAMLPIPTQLKRLNASARKAAEVIIKQQGRKPSNATPRLLKKVNDGCAEMNTWVERTARAWLDRGKLVGLIGGDHSTPFGLFRALAQKYSSFGILHIDAHADLRKAYEGFEWSHASIMYNVTQNIPQVVKIVQVAIRDLCEEEFTYIKNSKGRIQPFYDVELQRGLHGGKTWNSQVQSIASNLPEHVFISFDIDGLQPQFCPDTGTPVPGGVDFHQARELIYAVSKQRKIVGFDVNEVAPAHSGDEWNGNVGARLLYKLCLATLSCRG